MTVAVFLYRESPSKRDKNAFGNSDTLLSLRAQAKNLDDEDEIFHLAARSLFSSEAKDSE